ncbi:MAG: trypsin-like peptidase domain-containing protein [Spirochaetales bacterium]|nr:trypsin-like peptidase domain-containing protein [Spirochaetales bacterium]
MSTGNRTLFLLFGVIFFLAIGSFLGAQKETSSSRSTTPRLISGVPIGQVLEVVPGGESYKEYSVSIPENAYGVRFVLSDSPADLDLLLYRRGDDLFDFSEDDEFNEVLMLTRMTDPPLEPGTYLLEVAYQWARLPSWGGEIRNQIPFSLEMEIIETRPESVLRPGTEGTDSELSLEKGMMKAFEVEVPRGIEQLRIDLVGSQGDVDLFAFVGGIGPDPWNAHSYSHLAGSTEWIILNPQEDRTARYGIMVLALPDDSPVPFTLYATAGTQPPRSLLPFPDLPRPVGALPRALGATVEILDEFGGGSGVVVGSDGWILTNHHVVKTSAQLGQEVRVNITLDPAVPAQELYLAKIYETYPGADLALLKVESGLYGQPLPRNFSMTAIPLGNSQDLTLGQPLYFSGYPAIGALGSRSTLTLSRGVVSGFERRSFGVVIKTDGFINSGSSGGAAFDENGQLVGLPTIITYQNGGQLSFIHPLQVIPTRWWDLIGVAPVTRPGP